MKQFDLFAETPFPVLEKNIRQIWKDTPSGKAITDPAYLDFCNTLNRLEMSVHEATIFGVWDMTPSKAKLALLEWETRETRRNPDFLKDRKEEKRKAFFAN